MEQPKAMGDKVRAHVAGRNQRLRQSVQEYMGQRMPRQHGSMAAPWKNSKHALPLGLGVLPALAAINSRIYRSQQLWLMSARRADSFRCGSWAGIDYPKRLLGATDYTTAIYTGDVVEMTGTGKTLLSPHQAIPITSAYLSAARTSTPMGSPFGRNTGWRLRRKDQYRGSSHRRPGCHLGSPGRWMRGR